jgi:pimeloyl-ACP methyl ester carboxylesterase
VEPLPIFSDQQLHNISFPVLLLMGDKDALRDATKIANRLQDQISLLKVVVIPGGGHALINTTGAILSFLGQKENSAD